MQDALWGSLEHDMFLVFQGIKSASVFDSLKYRLDEDSE